VTAKDFADAEQARLYLIELGILDKAEEKYFSDTEATADYGQLLYLLGRLYTFLVS